MKHVLESFIKRYSDLSKPMLLGLSGGPDSLALYALLLKLKEKYPIKLAIAHIDHRWRAESSQEAHQLQEMVAKQGLPFHLRTLDPTALKGNLEDACRQERLKFFQELCREYGYQAVFVGHHADDQAETVLKRLFEGASIPNLSGLKECCTVADVVLWRPFLQVSKQTILRWLEQQNLKGFVDRTNQDPTYLRGRMRTRLLPILEEEFGKHIGASLAHVGAEAAEIKEYLDTALKDAIAAIEEGPQGLFLDFSQQAVQSPYEVKYLIRKLCEKREYSLSRQAMETAVHLISTRAADKEIQLGAGTLYIDRGRLFLTEGKIVPIQQKHALCDGMIVEDRWQVILTSETNRPANTCSTDWRMAWRGVCTVWLPESDYRLGPAQLTAAYPGSLPLSKWWTDAKVPAVLRRWIPVIWEQDAIRHEFLTGREFRGEINTKSWLKIQLLNLNSVYVTIKNECANSQ